MREGRKEISSLGSACGSQRRIASRLVVRRHLPQHVLEQDAERVREAGDVRVERVQAGDRELSAADCERFRAGHRSRCYP